MLVGLSPAPVQTSADLDTRSHFRPDIEGLRAVAVAIVVAFHAGLPGFSGGFTGVDVFFVVSGYLITGLLVREHQQHGSINVVQFYARRARRLLPAAALVLGATLLIGGLFVYSPLEQGRFARSAVSAFAYISNLRFMRFSGDYFAPETETDPFLHTWSLAVEEQFYLVWPVLIVLALRLRMGLPRLMVGLTAVSFVGYVALLVWRPQWAFFLMPARAWEFGIGALAAVIPLGALDRRFGWTMGLVGAAGVLLSTTAVSLYTVTAHIWPAASTALLLRCGAHQTSGLLATCLRARPMQWLGRLSYGIYLWHWPVLVLAEAFHPALTVPAKVGLIVCTVALAAISYHLLEHPVRSSRVVADWPRLTVCAGLSLSLAAAVIAALTARHADLASDGPLFARIGSVVATRPMIDTNGCTATLLEADPIECVFGDTSSPTTIVLFGDSHASQWFPALEAIANRSRVKLVTLVKSSCPAVNVTVMSARLHREFHECARWRAAAIDRTLDLRPSAVVIANFTRSYGPDFEAVTHGLRQVIERFSKAGIGVTLIHDTPSFPFDVPSCVARALHHGRSPEVCGLPVSTARDSAAFQAERSAAQGLARTMDVTADLCNSQTCAVEAETVLRYRDRHHLAVATVNGLVSPLRAALP